MQTALCRKMKERRERERERERGEGGGGGGEWIIGANTQNKPYLSIVATQYKTRQRCVMRLLIGVKARMNDG